MRPVAAPPDGLAPRPPPIIVCCPVPMKNAYSPGLRSRVEHDFEIANRHVLEFEGNFLFRLDSRLACRYPPKEPTWNSLRLLFFSSLMRTESAALVPLET